MEVTKINNGNMNDVFLVTNDLKKYILRTSNFDNTFECKVLRLLEKYKYHSPYILVDFKLHDKYMMIYEYLNGENPNTFDEKFFLQISSLLIHLHSINIEELKPYDNINEESVNKLMEYYDVSKKSKYIEKEKELIDKKIEQAKKINFNTLPKCIIHSDIKKENLITNEDDLYFIDFGNCYIGNRLVDISRIIMWFFIREKIDDNNLMKTFITSYLNNVSLTKEEYDNFYSIFEYCILYNLIKDTYLYENNILKKEYIENNSMIWLDELKNETQMKKIRGIMENAKRFTK